MSAKDIVFDFAGRHVFVPEEQDLLDWISNLHTALVNSGAWDRLVDYDTQTAQELELLFMVASIEHLRSNRERENPCS